MKIFISKISLSIILMIGILVSNCQNTNAEDNNGIYTIDKITKGTDFPNTVSKGTVFPDFNWEVNGKKVSFKEFTKGKVVFLNYWGTWCGPCRREIPYLIEIAKELKEKDFVIIGVPSERNPKKAVNLVTNYVKKSGINYINIIDTKHEFGNLLKIRAVPTTYIIGQDGAISEIIVGGKNKAGFMRAINKVLD